MSTVKSRTLEGRRIVITRAAEQARELREKLEERGAEVLCLPLIRFLQPESTTDLDRAIGSLRQFDWVIFTSANAVTFFLERCRALGTLPNDVSIQVAAVGSATESALKKEGLSASLVPAEFSGAALAKEFGATIRGRAVLLPRSDRATEELPAALRRAGANVTEVIAYRTAGPDTFDQKLVQTIRDGRVDAVTFFSPSAFHEFSNVLGPVAVSNLHSKMAFATVGPVTAEAVRSSGLPVAVEANEATIVSLIAALERHFAAREIGQSQATKARIKMTFPVQRPRRLRRTEALRAMTRETRLSTSGFVYPMFVSPGKGTRVEISSMPGVYQQSVDQMLEECREVEGLGIPGVILFGIPEHKDARGSEAWSPSGVVQRAIEAIRKAKLNLVVITDVCLCEYTDHGHCGVIENGEVANDPTLKLLADEALSHARAGADIVAPSDMMDGRVAAIRQALDSNGFSHLPIFSYAAKYCSGFYGPFREAAQSAPQFGDRRSYQMDPANAREALREVALDLDEGADMIMVKPALAYLDIIRQVRDRFDVPVGAYNVSGEYAMVKAAVRNGWLEEKRIVLEVLTAIQRAGAEIILTYHAKDVARWTKAC